MQASKQTNLHGDETIVDHDLLGQEVGANRRLVLIVELLVHILIH